MAFNRRNFCIHSSRHLLFNLDSAQPDNLTTEVSTNISIHQLRNDMTQVVLVLLLVFGGAFSSQPQTKTPQRAMAITIDDLPYVNSAYPVWLPNAKRVTTDILRVLSAHHA